MATLLLALLAGVLSTLSPCVLPIMPVVLGAASSEHGWGPAALAGGLALSFTAIGLFLATAGFALGIDGDAFRSAGALVMILIGGVLLVPAAQVRLAAAGGPVGDWMERHAGGFSTSGLSGQFAVGLLLGAVWSPCVGPTLGAASVMAARAENLPAVAATMLAFGIGAGVPLLLLGLVSRTVMVRWRSRMLATGTVLKRVLGVGFILVGLLVLSGRDKAIEAWAVEAAPDWLTMLSTRF